MKNLMELLVMEVLALGVVVALSGCDLLPSKNTTTVTVVEQLSVMEAAAAAIQANCHGTMTELQACYDSRAAKVLAVSNVLKSVTVGMLVADVQKALNAALADLNMTPEEAMPINVMVTQLLTALTPAVGNAAVTTQGLVIVQTVAAWVGDVAGQYSPPVKAQLMRQARFQELLKQQHQQH